MVKIKAEPGSSHLNDPAPEPFSRRPIKVEYAPAPAIDPPIQEGSRKRRSMRIRGKPEVEYNEINKKQRNQPSPTPTPTPTTVDAVAVKYEGGVSSNIKAKEATVDISALLSEKLGKLMPYSGKACVVDHMGNCGGDENDNDDDTIKSIGFNKMSGILEWKNAICLWVNIGGACNNYDNEFLDNGRLVTWYGGSRMHKETPVLVKLIERSRKKIKDIGVILWCRFVSGSNTEPYFCMGRCELVSHEEDSHPVKFTFRLVDYEKINESENEKFQQFCEFK